MFPSKAIISLAALLIATISALPTQFEERATAECPSGFFRMKLFTQNADGNMIWNGQCATDLGGPLGSTSSASSAAAFNVDSNSNLVRPSGYAGCLLTAPYVDQPTNTTILIPPSACQNEKMPMVQCTKSWQYNLCSAGDNKVKQQCGRFILFNPQKIASAGGFSCGPALNFSIDNC